MPSDTLINIKWYKYQHAKEINFLTIKISNARGSNFHICNGTLHTFNTSWHIYRYVFVNLHEDTLHIVSLKSYMNRLSDLSSESKVELNSKLFVMLVVYVQLLADLNMSVQKKYHPRRSLWISLLCSFSMRMCCLYF